jgi:FAD/FMN-containing dehydrogenase
VETISIDVAARDGGRVTLTRDQLAPLATASHGHILGPGDVGWDDAVHVWNGMIDKRPALVVQPETASEVASVVSFARERNLLLGIKCGGHNIAGTAIPDGGLMIDMSRLSSVTVDPRARLAHVGGGCRLHDVDRATHQHGLATTLGFISKTGVAGLTLGGGFGYLTRRFGWAADNLEQVELVTADGQIRTVDLQHDPDLFWAVRGGGGNFGVVTRFTFRVHDVGPTVTGGLIMWDFNRADEILDAYREITENAPREITVAAMIRLAPPASFVPQAWHLKPVVGLIVCYTGRDPDAALAPIRALGDPLVDMIGPKPYPALQSFLDDSEPDGLHQYWKTEYLPRVDSSYLKIFRDAALAAATPFSFSVIFHLEGALNERDHDDGAVGNRDAKYVSGFSGAWQPGENGEHIVEAVRRGWEQIRPFSTGGNYINFQLADDDAMRVEAAYGGNYPRLQRIKAAYDPDNLFRVNRNIVPAR